MKFEVVLTTDADEDLDSIYSYILDNDGAVKAFNFYQRIEKELDSLCHMPARGVLAREISHLGNPEYREIFFKPYRLIYRIIGSTVYVFMIADGRRDMDTLLSTRLFRS